MNITDRGYRGPQVCSIVGITYRQLDYWARTDLIRPTVADAKGSGTQRRYGYRDLVELKVVRSLLDAGVALQSARRAIDFLRTHVDDDLHEASLVISGTSVLVARTAAELFDITPRDLRGERRNQPLVYIRLAAMAVTRDATGLSYPAIGYEFGGRDHTSVINACQRRATNDTIGRYASAITEALNAKPLTPAGWTVTGHCSCGWTVERLLAVDTVRSLTEFVALLAERDAHHATCTATRGAA